MATAMGSAASPIIDYYRVVQLLFDRQKFYSWGRHQAAGSARMEAESSSPAGRTKSAALDPEPVIRMQDVKVGYCQKPSCALPDSQSL